jgi:hypothetical protein
VQAAAWQDVVLKCKRSDCMAGGCKHAAVSRLRAMLNKMSHLQGC